MRLVVAVVAVAVVVALLLRRLPATLIALLLALVVLLLALVTGIAQSVATQGTEARTNSGSFQTTATLITDDATDGSTTESAKHRSSLCIRP